MAAAKRMYTEVSECDVTVQWAYIVLLVLWNVTPGPWIL